MVWAFSDSLGGSNLTINYLHIHEYIAYVLGPICGL